ncbi:MAG: hypothetical protein VYD98_11550, partial [Bacteroidota bacterium]|nr:hypothetical protein [Bacteroidota bacterium]
VFGRYKFYNKRYFIAAVHAINEHGVVDWDRMREKVKQAPNILDPLTSSSKKDWIQNIESLYNHSVSKRVLLA